MTSAKILLQQGIEILRQAGIDDAENDARLLLEFTNHISRTDLLLNPMQEVEETQFLVCVKERASHIPLQHIVGTTVFMGHEFKVSDRVLVPRPDTEILTELAIKEIPTNGKVLDLCTGSGCILLSILLGREDLSGEGIDISEEALAVARQNGAAYPILKNRCRFYQSNLFATVHGKFDAIVSNPPYIETEVIATLSPEVREHDPWIALDGGKDGLDFYREIAAKAGEYLTEGGQLMLEIGYNQGQDVCSLLKSNGYQNIEIKKDYAGLDRVVKGNK